MPYRFVPLSGLVLLPDWGAQASHDHPFRDGVSGELDVALHCHTPLCLGGEQTASTDTTPARVSMFRTPDGEPAIPGSSLKGMLRNVLAIAAFARFRQVECQRLPRLQLLDEQGDHRPARIHHVSVPSDRHRRRRVRVITREGLCRLLH